MLLLRRMLLEAGRAGFEWTVAFWVLGKRQGTWCAYFELCKRSVNRGVLAGNNMLGRDLRKGSGKDMGMSKGRAAAPTASRGQKNPAASHQTSRILTRTPPGQRSQNPPHLLQGQGLQEAHPAQGYPVQGRQGTTATTSNISHAYQRQQTHTIIPRLPFSPRVSAVTTASNPDTVVRPSPSSTRRPRRPRRSCSG